MPAIFLCHASEDKNIAESVQLALTGAGYKVFFDQESLPPGGDYHVRIYEAIQECDIFVFLASQSSIAENKYTLAELKFARKRWPSPIKRVLPVLIDSVSPKQLPAYLQATTVLSVTANPAAEVRAAVADMLKETKSALRPTISLTIALGTLVIALSLSVRMHWPQNTSQPTPIERFAQTVDLYIDAKDDQTFTSAGAELNQSYPALRAMLKTDDERRKADSEYKVVYCAAHKRRGGQTANDVSAKCAGVNTARVVDAKNWLVDAFASGEGIR